MHTDEYEISIGREVNLCRKLIQKLRSAIRKHEKQHGMTTEEFLLRPAEGGTVESRPDFMKWRKDYTELQFWENMLGEYEKALENLE